jgi:hypothetical protein
MDFFCLVLYKKSSCKYIEWSLLKNISYSFMCLTCSVGIIPTQPMVANIISAARIVKRFSYRQKYLSLQGSHGQSCLTYCIIQGGGRYLPWFKTRLYRVSCAWNKGIPEKLDCGWMGFQFQSYCPKPTQNSNDISIHHWDSLQSWIFKTCISL